MQEVSRRSTEPAREDGTHSVMVLGADMPAYRMLAILCAYVLASHADSTSEDEAKLDRPNMRFGVLALKLLGHILAGCLLGVAVRKLVEPYGVVSLGPVFLPGLYYLLCVLFFRHRIVVWLIRFYQSRAPAKVRTKCVLTPSCSGYMILAIEKYGLRKGVTMGIERLRRCGPPARSDYP